jgi:hypothetical protein
MNQRTGNAEDVEVMEDSGTKVNWIPPKLADAYGLEIYDAPPSIGFLDFQGNSHVPTGYVKIPLTGNMPKAVRTEFFLAPENAPIGGLVIGNRFISTVGHPHTVFMDEPVGGGNALIMVQNRVTVGKGELSASFEKRQMTKH